MSENSKHEENAPLEQPVEVDAPRTTFIFVFAMIGLGVLALMLVAVDQYFGLSVREEVAQKLLRPVNTQLRQLRAEEQAKLGYYRWADRKAGIVRIPLERAMELTLAEWKHRPDGFVPGTPSPVAPPASAPAKPQAGESQPVGPASKSAQEPASAAPAQGPAPSSKAPGRHP